MKKLIALLLTLCMMAGVLPALAETTPAAAPETAPLDLGKLSDKILETIINSVINVSLADAQANPSEDPDAYKGTVFAAMEKVLTRIMEVMVKDESEEAEDLKKVVELLAAAREGGEVDEQELDTVSALVLAAILAAAQEKAQTGEVDVAMKVSVVNDMVMTVFETAQENALLAEAVKATESRLFSMLQMTNSRIMDYVEKTGEVNTVYADVDEAPFERFEAEVRKVEEYINGTNVRKQGALDILNLLHAVMDEIHTAIDGHSHADDYQSAAFKTGAAFGMNMDDVITVLGRAAYKIENDDTLGPVDFTELEYENVTVDGKHADEHYMFVENELVAIRICFEKGILTFDQARQDLTAMYGEFQDVDLSALSNGVYAVDDDGKLEGQAAGTVVDDEMMVVIMEDDGEVEVTFLDLTAAYILAT